MKKIFKYELKEGVALMPENGKIIRVDHVDDGFYYGDFVWAIVDVDDPKIERKIDLPIGYCAYDLYKSDYPIKTLHEKGSITASLKRIQLKIKEKQSLNIQGYPLRVVEGDGEIFLEYLTTSFKISNPINLSCFKTGQEIDIDIDNTYYLGLGRIWIIQELGLYFFLHKNEKLQIL